MRELILVIASVSIMLWKPVFAAPEIANAELRQSVDELSASTLVGDLAIIRYKTTETFVAPDGSADGFSGYVSTIWIKEDGDWLLLSAEMSSIARTD